jgi:hypothetical protein
MMRLRSWFAPCACVLVLACRSENADPAHTNVELGRMTQQLSEEHADQVHCNNLLTIPSKNLEATRESSARTSLPFTSTDAAAPPSEGAP